MSGATGHVIIMKQEINGEQFTFFPTSAPFPADHLEQSSVPFYSFRAGNNGQEKKTQHSTKIRSSQAESQRHDGVRLLFTESTDLTRNARA